MKNVCIGVIGAGWWATYAHIPAIESHPAAELVAVQSRERAKAERIARDFGAKQACTSVGELLALEEIDAVIVASTPNVHFAQAKAALHSGRHVLLEKPMTFTVAEARELVELAAKKKLHLVMSCPWHFTPHGIEARRLIHSGALGEIKMISVLMTNPIDKLLRGMSTSPRTAWRRFMSNLEPAPTTTRPSPAADKFIARFRTRRPISRFSPACGRRKYLRASTATVRRTTFTMR